MVLASRLVKSNDANCLKSPGVNVAVSRASRDGSPIASEMGVDVMNARGARKLYFNRIHAVNKPTGIKREIPDDG